MIDLRKLNMSLGDCDRRPNVQATGNLVGVDLGYHMTPGVEGYNLGRVSPRWLRGYFDWRSRKRIVGLVSG